MLQNHSFLLRQSSGVWCQGSSAEGGPSARMVSIFTSIVRVTARETSRGLCSQQKEIAKKTMMKESAVISKVVIARPWTGRAIQDAVNHRAWAMVMKLHCVSYMMLEGIEWWMIYTERGHLPCFCLEYLLCGCRGIRYSSLWQGNKVVQHLLEILDIREPEAKIRPYRRRRRGPLSNLYIPQLEISTWY